MSIKLIKFLLKMALGCGFDSERIISISTIQVNQKINNELLVGLILIINSGG